ncbi:DUF2273 domain-containing protein [Natroniella sulfidigena]|uniref:DUF2273 domain-containing protein n=1 Tax=Natroniella sulfidigena TaxID=723921 RepID=UPI00200B2A34|nr:DUF2273 domain-containing protein [Natroniella sulfidigena]MCK8817510.1 DUF2273 domain-containing protein [Natroniella sulfidigena]
MIELDDLIQYLSLLSDYKGRIIGVLLGFFISLLIIRFGVILALFILIWMGLGYYLGLRFDRREDIRDIINDILPPNE